MRMTHDANTQTQQQSLEHNTGGWAPPPSPRAGDGVLGLVQADSQYVQGAGEDLQGEVEQSDSEAWGRGGKANRLNDVCLNICLARLGLPLPPACFKLPCPACQRRVYLIHFVLACESPLCEVKTPRAPVVWRHRASFGKHGRKFYVSKPWSVANWVLCFSDSLSQRISTDAELSNPPKKTTAGRRDGSTGRTIKDLRCPTADLKADDRVCRGERG